MSKGKRALRLCSGRTAFTLVELLVVVAIIAVLLAMLTPALDRAVYRAELTVCAGQLKVFGNGLTAGAVDRNRRYPKRLTRAQPIDVNQKDLVSGQLWDERPELQAYLITPINKVLNCPLSKPVDIEKAAPDTLAQTSYAMWHGWLTGPSESVMNKLGDGWSYAGERFKILANDYELFSQNLYSGQPDRDGVLKPYIVNDAGALGGWDKQTTSTWYIETAQRGLISVNTIYTDNSLLTTMDVQPYQVGDDRMTFVPNGYGTGTITAWQRVPTQ